MRPSELRRALLGGLVIPAHPLALTAERRLDERRQAALTRYYCDAGAGGVAVGVHTTQFAIRDPGIDLLRPVLELAVRTTRAWCPDRRVICVAGVCGPTPQAVAEAELAASLGYDIALVSLAALRDRDNDHLLDHCRRLAPVLPLMGFYLQPAVGGRVLDRAGFAAAGGRELLHLLALGAELTVANAAIFDASHGFAGCIAGIHEVLRRQRLLAGRWCLDPREDLSRGQAEAIDLVAGRYPHLTDDAFVKEHLDQWLNGS
jgi:hypothetical protein